MSRRCSVPNCYGNYRRGPKVTVFKFPKDSELVKKWIRAIKGDFVLTPGSRVCELHFAQHDVVKDKLAFDIQARKMITVPLRTPRLREGAIPSKLPMEGNDIETSEDRKQRKEQGFDRKSNTEAEEGVTKIESLQFGVDAVIKEEHTKEEFKFEQLECQPLDINAVAYEVIGLEESKYEQHEKEEVVSYWLLDINAVAHEVTVGLEESKHEHHQKEEEEEEVVKDKEEEEEIWDILLAVHAVEQAETSQEESAHDLHIEKYWLLDINAVGHEVTGGLEESNYEQCKEEECQPFVNAIAHEVSVGLEESNYEQCKEGEEALPFDLFPEIKVTEYKEELDCEQHEQELHSLLQANNNIKKK